MNIVINEDDESNHLYRIVRCTAAGNQILSVIGKPLFKENEIHTVDLLKEGFRSATYADLVRGVVDAPRLNGEWNLVDYHGVRIMKNITPETEEESNNLLLFLDYDESQDDFSFLLMEDETCELKDITTANKHKAVIESAMQSIEMQLLTLSTDAGLRARTINKEKVLEALK